MFPPKVCVLVETNPLAVTEAVGIFKVKAPPSATGEPDTLASTPDDPKDNPMVEFTSLSFAIVPATISPFTIELARFNLLYAIAALPEISTLVIVPSSIFDDVIELVAILITPDEFKETSPVTDTNVGIPDPFANNNCPEVPVFDADKAPVPLP